MIKRLDFEATKQRAIKMNDAQLKAAYEDTVSTAQLWDRSPDADHDGNGPFYHDEASVYAAEMKYRLERLVMPGSKMAHYSIIKIAMDRDKGGYYVETRDERDGSWSMETYTEATDRADARRMWQRDFLDFVAKDLAQAADK